MKPLSAEILTEEVNGDHRSAVRRSLRLGVSAHSGGDVAMALILNISERGLLIETLVDLAVGETLQVDIPEASGSRARVIWTDGFLAGCEFVTRLPTRAVSAVQLKSSAAPTATREIPQSARNPQQDLDPWDYDEAYVQTAIVIVTSLVSVMALLIFLAAVLPL
jgi:hypothetical protein